MGNFVLSPVVHRYAAGSKGYGAVFGKHWFCDAWSDSWKSLNIAFLELFPIVIALHIWGPYMANRCVAFYTDNAAIVDIINRQTSKHQLVIILVRGATTEYRAIF